MISNMNCKRYHVACHYNELHSHKGYIVGYSVTSIIISQHTHDTLYKRLGLNEKRFKKRHGFNLFRTY